SGSATRGRRRPERHLVLREELDDALLVGRHVDLAPLRPMSHFPGQRLLIGGKPLRNTETKADRIADERLDGALGFDRDRLAGPDFIRGAVDALAADEDVAMAHELSSLGARAGESQTVDDVVEALLELAE